MKYGIGWYGTIVLFIVIFTVGAWFRAVGLNRRLPTAQESADLWATTACVEAPPKFAEEMPFSAKRNLFHWASGTCAVFVGEANRVSSLRYARVAPFVCSLLALGLIPLFGLSRRGGLFRSADGPLWTMAFVALSPVLIWQTMTFNIHPFSGVCFLGILLLARAYAQWPSFVPATILGLLCALLLSLDGDMVWFIAVFIPAAIVGIGWTRVCLYWRTSHLICALFGGGAVFALCMLFHLTDTPSLPALQPFAHAFLAPILWRLGWLCSGGLGIIAWGVLALGGGFRPEHRWTRFFIVLFPACFMGSLFFEGGGIFVLPLIYGTPILAGLALISVKSYGKRAVVGGLLLCSLFTVCLRTLDARAELLGTRAQQKRTLLQLREALKTPQTHPYRVRIVSSEPTECGALLWLLRAHVDTAVYGPKFNITDADILLLRDKDLSDNLKALTSPRRPGQILLPPDTYYRLFVTRATKE